MPPRHGTSSGSLMTPDERRKFWEDAGLPELGKLTSPGAGATTLPPASNPPPNLLAGAPGAVVAQPAAPGTPLPGIRPGQPGFVDPYGLGSFMNLEQPGGPPVEPTR